VLEAILPPRRWTAGGKTYEQHISTEQSTRQDVVTLQEALEVRLRERQSRTGGLCPIRQELFGQLTDELIRQIAVNSPERGILLLRIRDEMRMSIAAYQTLYESSVIFATRKQLEAQDNKIDGTPEIEALNNRKLLIQEELTQLEISLETHSRRQAERDLVQAKKRADELEFLTQQHSHLESFLKTIEKQQAEQSANN
jgi:dynein light intermediate chain, axonemal